MWARFIAVLLALCAFAAPAAAQDGRWLRAESDNFIVYGMQSESQLRQAAQSLEDFDRVLRLLTGARQDAVQNKLDVYLLRRHDDLRQVWPDVPENVGGFYRAGSEQIAAFLVYDSSGGIDRNTVLFHEYAHHFMLHYFPHAYPSWYVEGWAEHVSTMEFRGRRASVGMPSEARGSWIEHGGGVLPINALLAPERVTNRDENFQAQFYANAWFAVIYISNHAEFAPRLDRYVEALGQGGDPIEAFEPAFGMTPEQFRRELQDFRRNRINVLNLNLPPNPVEVTVTRLPVAADTLLLPLARMRAGVAEDQEAALSAEGERLAAAYPDDPMARIVAARAALLRDDYTLARTRVESILTVSETDAEARYLLAYTMLREAAAANDNMVSEQIIRAARRELVRGFRNNPNHFPTLLLYATTFAGGYEPMNEEQLNVLARALELAPQADHIRLTFARELMAADRNVAAVITLRPLIYAPHGGEIAAQARILFDRANERTTPP